MLVSSVKCPALRDCSFSSIVMPLCIRTSVRESPRAIDNDIATSIRGIAAGIQRNQKLISETDGLKHETPAVSWTVIEPQYHKQSDLAIDSATYVA